MEKGGIFSRVCENGKNFFQKLEAKVFHQDDFEKFLSFLQEHQLIDSSIIQEVSQQLGDREIQSVLKVWIQAEPVTYSEYIFAFIYLWILEKLSIGQVDMGIISKLGSYVVSFFDAKESTENLDGLFLGTGLYAGMIIPTIVLTRYLTLYILTQKTSLSKNLRFKLIGSLPIPTPVILGLWLQEYKNFAKCLILYYKCRQDFHALDNHKGDIDSFLQTVQKLIHTTISKSASH